MDFEKLGEITIKFPNLQTQQLRKDGHRFNLHDMKMILFCQLIN